VHGDTPGIGTGSSNKQAGQFSHLRRGNTNAIPPAQLLPVSVNQLRSSWISFTSWAGSAILNKVDDFAVFQP